MNNSDKLLSIIIVSWNVQDYLHKCLQSIYKYNHFDFEVVVVDNGSTDKTVAMVKGNYPGVKIVVNKDNQGFAVANNQAVKISVGKFLLFLNPDTEFIDDSLFNTIKYLENNKPVGLLTVNVLNSDKTNQVAVRQFPTLYSQIITLYKLNNIWPRLNRVYHCYDFDYNKTQPVNTVIGAFMLCRTDEFKAIGMFDEDYYIWFEEVDLCQRYWDKNRPIMYYSQARIVHHGGQSLKQMLTIDKQAIFNKSLLTYFKKHQPSWQYYLLNSLIPINFLLTHLQQILKIKKRGY